MNREIKFRVWNKHYKEYVKPSDGCSDYSFIQYKSGNFSLFGVSAECLVIQQYTGLKDKNGKEIYEGDICKVNLHGYMKTNTIVFQNGAFCFDGYAMCQYNEEQIFEIIGNIFENPELMK